MYYRFPLIFFVTLMESTDIVKKNIDKHQLFLYILLEMEKSVQGKILAFLFQLYSDSLSIFVAPGGLWAILEKALSKKQGGSWGSF